MLPERRFKKAFATVTLGMLDGRAKGGRLTAFSPSSTEQRLEIVGGRGGNVTVLVPTEQIAYVAFQREPGERITRVKGRRPVRVYTSGSVPLVLEVDPKALTSTIGFYGTPVAEDSPDAEVFVYAHGVHATESVEPTKIGRTPVDGSRHPCADRYYFRAVSGLLGHPLALQSDLRPPSPARRNTRRRAE